MSYNLMDKILVDLKIISKIPENGKINTSNYNQLYLENDNIFQGMIRFLKGDSRNKTIEKIDELIGTTKQIAQSILNSNNMNIYNNQNNTPSNFEINEFNNNCNQLKSLSNELNNAQKGINNLKITYKNDTYIESKLEVIYENMRRLIIEIESGVENKLPK
jgi:hypothetical protein